MLGKFEAVAEQQELYETAKNIWLAKESILSVFTAVKDFSLDENAVFPNLGQSATQDTYNMAPVYRYVTGF